MSISRKQLYEAGEPFGDSCTRAKLGGGYVCGFGGKSSSSSATTNETTINNVDKRAVVDGGSVGVTGDRNAVTINSTSVDSGSVEAGKQVALSALANNATNTEHLFAASEQLFSQIGKNLQSSIDLTSTLAAGANAAYSDATAQATGNKSIILVGLAVVGLAAVVVMGKK